MNCHLKLQLVSKQYPVIIAEFAEAVATTERLTAIIGGDKSIIAEIMPDVGQ